MPQMSMLRARPDTDDACPERLPPHAGIDRPNQALYYLQ